MRVCVCVSYVFDFFSAAVRIMLGTPLRPLLLLLPIPIPCRIGNIHLCKVAAVP